MVWSPGSVGGNLDFSGINPNTKRIFAPGQRVPLPRRIIEPDDTATQSDKRMQSVYDRLGVVDDMSNDQYGNGGGSDYLERAEDMMFRANQLNLQAQQIRNTPSYQGGGKSGNSWAYNYVDKELKDAGIIGGGGGGKPRSFRNFIQAISGQESGGNYGAVNSSSGAMGKYQIMPANIQGSGGWDQEALGRNITTQQFLSSPKLQEAIARYKLRNYYNNYGIRGAASAWYSGDPNKWKYSKGAQGNYPSIHNYVMDILRKMGLK